MFPELLTLIDIGDVRFHGRNAGGCYRITERNACMRIGAWIYYDGLIDAHGFLDFLDQLSLMIRLIERHLNAELTGKRGKPVVDVVKGERSIDFRLTLAKKVQIGPVNDQDFHASPVQNKKLPKAVYKTTALKINEKCLTAL